MVGITIWAWKDILGINIYHIHNTYIQANIHGARDQSQSTIFFSFFLEIFFPFVFKSRNHGFSPPHLGLTMSSIEVEEPPHQQNTCINKTNL